MPSLSYTASEAKANLRRWIGGCGTLQFLGRFDTRVKLHGLRMEPGEVEVARPAPGAIARLMAANSVADVPAREPAEQRAADLQDAVADPLPEYVASTENVLLDEIPL
jgi:hypothetical protein